MAGNSPSYTKFSRLSRAKANEYSLVTSKEFRLIYRNSDDITTLPPGVLIVGSQNVLHNNSNRIQIRQGYSVDGATSTVAAAILGSYDFNTFAGTEEHIRSGFLTTAGNDGKLQFRYIDSNGIPQWFDLLTGLSATKFRWTNFWDTTESKQLAVGVNGTPNFYEWNGAHSTVTAVSNSAGNILTYNTAPTNGGSGYSVGDILTVTTGGTGATFRVTQIGQSPIVSATTNIAGFNFQVNDLLNPSGAGSGGQLKVTGINGSGGLTTLTVQKGGSGYKTDSNVIAAGNGSSSLGYGATVDLTVSATTGIVAVVEMVSPGAGYTTGTGKSTSGGTGTGATLEIDAVTQNTITIADDVAAFYQGRNMNIVINGVTYTYNGISGNTFIGISADPTSIPIGSVIAQAVVVTPNSETTLPATFKNHLIGTLSNRVYVAGDESVNLYISKVDSYTDYSFTSPVRLVGEGGLKSLDGIPTAIIVQESNVYVSAGRNFWYTLTPNQTTLTVADVPTLTETIDVARLKTTPAQAAQSQEMTSHQKNDVVFISSEPTMDTLGRVQQILGTPNTLNISNPIKIDFDSYDFTDGSVFYFRYFVYVAVPKEGLVRIFNLANNAWEAPQTIPISLFYVVDGELYGHGYNTSESYKLFTGYADRVYTGFTGFPINAIASFSYEQFGSRSALKRGNALYVEGYITPNTILTCTITYELDGCASTQTFEVDGSDTQIVCIPNTEGSLGKTSLGKQKLGGAGSNSLTRLPPKFRVEKTFPNKNFFECSVSFSVLGVDNRFELLAFGLNNGFASEEPVFIRQ